MSDIDEKKQVPTKYLWLDLEMTGLDVPTEKIIEVGAIVTDTDLKEISEFHCTVKQPQEFFDRMDDWNQNHHKNSGLLDLIEKSGKSPSDAENELIMWCKEHFGEERIILAGNSINHDKNFLDFHFKEFSKLLHYRVFNVTAWKIPFSVQGIIYEKKNVHRAMDDIRESIEEFRFLWKYVSI